MNVKKVVYDFDMNNVKERYELGEVAEHANGAVLLKSKNTVILATICIDDEPKENVDFVPLTVQYVEKAYAGHKIPSGFIKREQRPSEFELLTSRIIDRSLRVLFPKGYHYNTVINVIVLSCDKESDLQVLALNAASSALYNSNIPISQAISAVRVGKIGDEFIINPSLEQKKVSEIDAFVSGNNDQILMIEMKSNKGYEIEESKLVEVINFASESIKMSSTSYTAKFNDNNTYKKEDLVLELKTEDENKELSNEIKNAYENKISDIVSTLAKTERDGLLKKLAKQAQISSYENNTYDEVYKAMLGIKRSLIRDNILNNSLRPDGRGLKDIRDISISTNILPNAHGSCLFTRGQTQALCVATIGSEKDGQIIENLSDGQKTDHFTLHYNFPGFSVGEASILSAPGRRELGHGNLAKRAIENTLNLESKTSIRIVSEILASNGSSSMATICGSSIALKCIKADISKLSAGVAMGLVSDENTEAILSDITGLEDHEGDMDFKIAGTKDGITALQLDIKVGGISLELLQRVFTQAKVAREHILDIMEVAVSEIKFNGEILPSSKKIMVDTNKTMLIIGSGGKTIKLLTSDYNVSIDIDRESGEVKVTGDNEIDVDNACDEIIKITGNQAGGGFKKINFLELYSIDDEISGKVKKIVDFGAFMELEKGGEGLLHISKISKERISNVSSALSEGEELQLKVLAISKDRIELSKI